MTSTPIHSPSPSVAPHLSSSCHLCHVFLSPASDLLVSSPVSCLPVISDLLSNFVSPLYFPHHPWSTRHVSLLPSPGPPYFSATVSLYISSLLSASYSHVVNHLSLSPSVHYFSMAILKVSTTVTRVLAL